MEFKAKFALFTAGHSLIPAAYYHIYFAKELHQREGALYIDSDTIIRASLHELFETPLHSH